MTLYIIVEATQWGEETKNRGVFSNEADVFAALEAMGYDATEDSHIGDDFQNGDWYALVEEWDLNTYE